MGTPWQREKFSLSVAKKVFGLNLFPMPLKGAEASDLLATPLNVSAAPVTASRVPADLAGHCTWANQQDKKCGHRAVNWGLMKSNHFEGTCQAKAL